MKSYIKINYKFYCMVCSIICFSFNIAASYSSFDEEEMHEKRAAIAAPAMVRVHLPIGEPSRTIVSSTVANPETNWRQGWFVKNIVTEIPIIGDFFYDPNVAVTLKRVGKSTVMLVGGGLGMMVLDLTDMSSMSRNHNMAIQVSKATASMACGMMIAAIFYNTLISLGTLVKNRIC